MVDSGTIVGVNANVRQRVLGDGFRAWRFDSDHDGLDNYSRRVPIVAKKGSPLTIAAVERMFRQDFGITSAQVYKANGNELSIILFADSGDALKRLGWGEHSIGELHGYVAEHAKGSFAAAVRNECPAKLPEGVTSLVDRIEANRKRPHPREH